MGSDVHEYVQVIDKEALLDKDEDGEHAPLLLLTLICPIGHQSCSSQLWKMGVKKRWGDYEKHTRYWRVFWRRMNSILKNLWSTHVWLRLYYELLIPMKTGLIDCHSHKSMI